MNTLVASKQIQSFSRLRRAPAARWTGVFTLARHRRKAFDAGVVTVSPSPNPGVLFLLCVAVLSVLEFRALDVIQGRNLPAEVAVAAGVESGHPYWKAYQNRLLGPEMVGWTSRLTGLPAAAVYQGFCFGLLCAANAVGGCLFRHSRGLPGPAWGYVVASAGLFVAFQDPEWLYLWDYVDLITMLLFAWAVVMGGWRAWQFGLLFLVELANREAAQFIALWLVLDALRPDAGSGGHPARWVDLPRLGLGVVLGVVGTGWTHFVRNALCAGETGVVPRKEIVEFADGQFFMGQVTLDLLRDPWNLVAGALGTLLVALGFLLWQARRSLGPCAWKVAVLLTALVAANLCFSFIYELRVWFNLLPFAVCLAYRRQTGGAWVRSADPAHEKVVPSQGAAA